MMLASFNLHQLRMWLNSTAQNALRAVLVIAAAEGDDPVRVDEIAAALESPRNYLSKTLNTLARVGVLTSMRGRHGGFLLAAAPTDLMLARVIEPFQPAGQRRCLLGRPKCGQADPCVAHARWSQLASQIEDFLGKTSIAELLAMDPAVRPI